MHTITPNSPKYICQARLLAKGFMQVDGVDYSDIFSPVAKLASTRTLLSIAVQFGFKILHLDVCTAFLNSNLADDVFISVPEGFSKFYDSKINVKNKVIKLNKALYGLKQSSLE